MIDIRQYCEGKVRYNQIQREVQMQRARSICAILGYFRAAEYLKSKGWSIEGAKFILLRK